MSPNQKADQFLSQLDKWKAHNEVHARPSDSILYDLLKDLFSLLKTPEYEIEDDGQEEQFGGEVIGPISDPALASVSNDGIPHELP